VSAFAIIAAAACSDDSPTAASTFSGLFDLSTIDGLGLPYRSYVVPMTFDTLYITGGEVRVLTRGRVSVVRRSRWHTAAAGPQSEISDTVVLRYTETGDRVLLEYPQFGAMAAHTDTAVLAGGALTVRTLFDFGGGDILVRVMAYSR